jgi:hypothetical protein
VHEVVAVEHDMTDLPLEQAVRIVEGAAAGDVAVHSVFDEATFTATHVGNPQGRDHRQRARLRPRVGANLARIR